MKVLDLTYIIFIFLMAVFSLKYIQYENDEVSFVKAEYDNEEYLVLNKQDKYEAANLLAEIKTDLSRLINRLVEKYPDTTSVRRLKDRFHPDNISEGDGTNGYTTSYTENKGEKIVFCLRSQEANEYGKLHDKNILLFVALHELAHIMSESYSTGVHNDEFFQNFKFLLREATEAGIYRDVDYQQKPEEFCGVMVTSRP